ncbi:hypothetical protein ACFYQT_39860 [Streptomyces tibetensis]|uniref:Uncharacterized protein n=1 Tax=Streptomyces tibetensis TaxID=2382123 RepID=A0ABW6NAW5_9ACTN
MAGSIRNRLATAASELKKAGRYDSAAAVEAVIAPRGYLLLKKDEERASASTLTITITEDLKKALVDAGEEFGVVFSGLAEEAYRKVRDEGWIPAKPVRGPGGPKAVLNVSVDDSLRQDVRAMLPGLSEAEGYRVAEANIVLTHICEELGIERPNTGPRESLEMRFPKALVQHWTAAAEEQGRSLQDVVEDGISDLLNGSWSPERHPYFTTEKRGRRVRSWSEKDRQRLWLPVDERLLAELRAKAQEMTGQLGYLVYPGSIVRAILTERLGEPAE